MSGRRRDKIINYHEYQHSKITMKVLQLISSGGFFGAEKVLLQLSSELQKDKNYHTVVGVLENLKNPHLEIIEECQKDCLEKVAFPCRGKLDLKAILSIRRFIRSNNVNIIHSHNYKSNLYAFIASRGLPIGLIATCHNWLVDDIKMKGYATLDRIVLRQFSDVCAVSHYVRKKAIDSGISPTKVHIVNNGISLDSFSSLHRNKNIRKELGISDTSTVIGTVGRLSAEKGHRVLLRIAKKILETHPESVFLIIGDGPLKSMLENEFSSPSIIFTGLRKDLVELYSQMDIFVLPSLKEGLPMVILEAMASKTPIIATSVGAIPTVLKDKETGLLVQPGNEEELSEALLSLMKKPDEMKSMAEKAYLKVRDYYSSEKMADGYKALYARIEKQIIETNRYIM